MKIMFSSQRHYYNYNYGTLTRGDTGGKHYMSEWNLFPTEHIKAYKVYNYQEP